jgi:Protein of unknown function (DUF732)
MNLNRLDDRLDHPLRLAKGSHLPGSRKGCAKNVISNINGHRGARRVGIAGMAVLAAMALGANPVANATPTDFIGAVQAAGVNGLGPALLVNGNNVCWQIWNGGYTGQAAAAALQKDYPTLTTDQAAHFVLAAYQDLCPTQGAPGEYDWWTYSNGSPG